MAQNMTAKSTHRLNQPTDEAVSLRKGLKHTSKRRKLDSEYHDGGPPSRAVVLQRSQLEHEIEHGTKILHRALKVARGFERQKLGRRQKAAKDKKDRPESARLEAEVAALKARSKQLWKLSAVLTGYRALIYRWWQRHIFTRRFSR